MNWLIISNLCSSSQRFLFTLIYIIHSGYIFWKMEEIQIKYAVFILIMLTSFVECEITTISVNEGAVAFLNFTYSCDSKEITLQRGNGAPFYNSGNPTTPPPSYKLELKNETDGESCFLYLTIDPVSRDDQGGYILFAYKNDPTPTENYRILLLVSYPPGKASCSFSEEHIDPDWARLQCTAPLGNIGGFIMCYQDGIKISPLNSPQEHDETLSQTLLAKVGSLVYCCSSTLGETKDRCDCQDSAWDPTQNKQVTNVTGPCPPTVPIQNPTFSQQPIEDNDYESFSPSTNATKIISQQPNSTKAVRRLHVVIVFLILAYMASMAGTVYYFKRHPKKSASQNMEMAELKPVSGVKIEKDAGRDGEWRLIDTINVKDEITQPIIAGCTDECNVIITDRLLGSLYTLDINTKHTKRVITSSDTSFIRSCALLNDDKVICGKQCKGCTGDSLTGCISVYDRQWKLIDDITIPRNTTGDVTMVDVAVDQDGMIIAAEGGQSKIYVVNPADGNIMNTIICKQKLRMRGVLSSGHIIAQPYPADHRVFIINREGVQREITHSDVILNVCIDPVTDDLYVMTADDEHKTCVIDQVMSKCDTMKRRVASIPVSTRLMNIGGVHLLNSLGMMTSSGNMIACNGDDILIFKMFSD